MTFEQALAFVLKWEGGLVDDPKDPGGVTNCGISQRAYPDLDVRGLTPERIAAIYRRDYWDHLRCGELPNGLNLAVFDSAVNQGQHAAAVLLQRSLGVQEDGIVGAVTIRRAQEKNSADLIGEFLAQRMNQYALNPQVTRYGLGWYRRVAAAAQLAFGG